MSDQILGNDWMEEANNRTVSSSIEPRNLSDIEDKSGNIYQSLVILSKRSKQINGKLKEELQGKLAEFATVSDNLEEVFENREQIEISKNYEKMPHPTLLALEEFYTDKIYYRKQDEE